MADENVIEVRILGLEELEAKLVEEAPKMAKKYLRQMERKAGKIWKDAISEAAPRESGFLSEHIRVKTHYDKGESEMIMEVGPEKDAYWGLFEEYGTREVDGTAKDGKPFHHAATPPQPFMRPAFENTKDQVLEAFKEAAEERLEDLKQQ